LVILFGLTDGIDVVVLDDIGVINCVAGINSSWNDGYAGFIGSDDIICAQSIDAIG